MCLWLFLRIFLRIFCFVLWLVIIKDLPSLFLFQSSVHALDPCTSAGVPGYHNDHLVPGVPGVPGYHNDHIVYHVDHNECHLEVVFA